MEGASHRREFHSVFQFFEKAFIWISFPFILFFFSCLRFFCVQKYCICNFSNIFLHIEVVFYYDHRSHVLHLIRHLRVHSESFVLRSASPLKLI